MTTKTRGESKNEKRETANQQQDKKKKKSKVKKPPDSIMEEKVLKPTKPGKSIAKKVAKVRQIEDKKKIEDEAKKSKEEKTTEKLFLTEGNEDMTKLDRGQLKKKRMVIGGIIAFLIVVLGAAIAGFLIFNTGSKHAGSVDLSISGPTEITSGAEVIYEVTYKNQEKASLRQVTLKMDYPQGFHFIKAEPQVKNQEGTEWDLSSVAAGAGGKVKIYGILTGAINSQKLIKASLVYRPSNFDYDFQKLAEIEATITDSLLALEISGPTKVIPEQIVEYTIKYQNTSEQDLESGRLIVNYPEDFVFQESEPKTDSAESNNQWNIESIKAEAEGEVMIKGKLGGNPGDSKEIIAQIGLVDKGSEFNLQTEASLISLIVQPQLKISLRLNNQDEELIANWGDELSYMISYHNQGDVSLSNVEFKLFFESKIFDLDSLTVTEGELSGNKLVFNRNTLTALQSLKPDDLGEITFSAKLQPTYSPKSEADKNFHFEQQVTATSEGEGLEATGLTYSSNEVTLKINSRINLVAEARYYSDELEPVGSGPLPPEVGKTTTYRIYWYLSNTTNDISRVSVSTTLPNDVLWNAKSRVTAGDNVTFDPETRIVNWSIAQVSALTGSIFPGIQAYFEVEVTPTEADLGKLLRLTEKTTVSAKDLFTGETLELEKDILTSSLDTDVGGRGKGEVVRPSSQTNTNQAINSNANTNANVNLNSNSNTATNTATNTNTTINTNRNTNTAVNTNSTTNTNRNTSAAQN